jgi:hypothetical protein
MTLSRLAMSSGLNASLLFTHLPSFSCPSGVSQPRVFFSQSYDILEELKGSIRSLVLGLSFGQTMVLIFCIAWALEPLFEKPPAVTNAVYHGYLSWLEPTIFLKARFIVNARALISSGSLQVRRA